MAKGKAHLNGAITRSDLDAIVLPTIKAKVPEWSGKSVYIRTLSGRERAVLLMRHKGAGEGNMAGDAAVDFLIDLLCQTLAINAAGERLFADDERDVLADKIGNSLMTLGNKALVHNGFGEAGEDAGN